MTTNSGQQDLFTEPQEGKTAMAAAKEPKYAPKDTKAEDRKTEKVEKSGGGDRSSGETAESMAKRQREISVSEFFTKNRHLLGFDSPRKALLTAVKEAVDNSLDACEEARIMPDIRVTISKLSSVRTITYFGDLLRRCAATAVRPDGLGASGALVCTDELGHRSARSAR